MAQAAEIIILAGQGVVSAVRDVASAFERASGHKVSSASRSGLD
jgi:hypothetical protein